MTAPTVDTYRHALGRLALDLSHQAEKVEQQIKDAAEARDSLGEVQRLVLKRAEVLAQLQVLGDLYLNVEDNLLTSVRVADLAQ